MKTTIRLPLGQFEFIEQTFDMDLTPEAAVAAFNALQRAYKGGEGMDEKELDVWVYNMLLGKGNNADVYQKATPAQGKELHRIKRQLAKIKRNQGMEEELNYGDDDRKDQADRD